MKTENETVARKQDAGCIPLTCFRRNPKQKRDMKTRHIIIVLAALSLPLTAQPQAALPSDEAWQTIQAATEFSGNAQPPSEMASGDLRAERPTEEVPIGGLDAPLPESSLPVMITFALMAAATLIRRKMKSQTEKGKDS